MSKMQMPEPPVPEPPDGLSERAQSLWRVIVESHRVMSAPRLVLLQTALETLDRLDEVRAVLSVEGLTTTTEHTGARHVHPLLKTELELRRQFATLWGQLGLRWDSVVDGRVY